MKTKNYFRNAAYAAAFVATALFTVGCEDKMTEIEGPLDGISNKNGGSTSSLTAQSVFADVLVSETEIEGDLKWTFDHKGMAKKYFAGMEDAVGRASSQKCVFFDGGDLYDNRGNFVATVEKGEGWSSEGSNGATEATPKIDISIAAQSLVVNSSKKTGTAVKYSFSLTQERISNLRVEIKDENNNSMRIYDISNEMYEIMTDPAKVGPFVYASHNGGRFGDETAKTHLKSEMTIKEILLLNDYSSTDVSGGIAVLNQLELPLEEGSYKVIVSGNIKGNSVDSPVYSFSVETVGLVTAPCKKQ